MSAALAWGRVLNESKLFTKTSEQNGSPFWEVWILSGLVAASSAFLVWTFIQSGPGFWHWLPAPPWNNPTFDQLLWDGTVDGVDLPGNAALRVQKSAYTGILPAPGSPLDHAPPSHPVNITKCRVCFFFLNTFKNASHSFLREKKKHTQLISSGGREG